MEVLLAAEKGLSVPNFGIAEAKSDDIILRSSCIALQVGQIITFRKLFAESKLPLFEVILCRVVISWYTSRSGVITIQLYTSLEQIPPLWPSSFRL